MVPKFFYAVNLTGKSVKTGLLPWDFKPTEKITAQIRHDKEERQNWYRSIDTRHYFYTLIEASNPNQRASKDNPPRLLHGFAADYDLKLTPERVAEAIATMEIKPAWTERSLGGNVRLIWLFQQPLIVDSYDFCSALLMAAVDWLKLELLPGLDKNAFTDPTRLLCNGCDWSPVGEAMTLSTADAQNFFVEAGREFRFTTAEGAEIPLDKIEKAIVEKFPNFSWPSEFAPETTGPSFWIADSESSNSAILKKDGFFTFSAHADKPFYTWADILGADFVKAFNTDAIAKATADIWFDGKRFWRRKKGIYTAMDMAELSNFLKTDCGIGRKQLDLALSHIYNENCIENAAPYLFRPSGLLMYQGRRRLNTSMNSIVQPTDGPQVWGPSGSFPFLSLLLDNIFTSLVQRDHFLAWFKYFYESGLNSCPMPGPAVFFMGGVGTGKTFTSREIVGRAVGGYVDAASYIIRGAEFNSHVFEQALWVMDDDTISDSPQAAANVQAMLKKSVANNSFLSNKKFQVAGMVEWHGRIIATTNLDYLSSRMLGPLDNSSFDKISVFRCQKISQIKFPSRPEMERLVSEELPYLLRWLVDHTPPEEVKRDNRFGFCSWHEPSLMDQAAQTSKAAPFKELLIETLEEYFQQNPEAPEWRGTVTRLLQQLHLNPMHECVIRTLRLEQVSRYLENIEKDGGLRCHVETGAHNSRLWVFPRIDTAKSSPAPASLPPTALSIFAK